MYQNDVNDSLHAAGYRTLTESRPNAKRYVKKIRPGRYKSTADGLPKRRTKPEAGRKTQADGSVCCSCFLTDKQKLYQNCRQTNKDSSILRCGSHPPAAGTQNKRTHAEHEATSGK